MRLSARSIGLMFGVFVVASVLLLTNARHAAHKALSVTKVQLKNGRLRVEGEGARPNAKILIDHMALGTADNRGRFRISLEGVSSLSSRATVSDGFTSQSVSLVGGTPERPGKPQFFVRRGSGLVGEELGFRARAAATASDSLAFVYDWGDGFSLRDPDIGFHRADPGTGAVTGGRVSHAWGNTGTLPVTVTAVDPEGRSTASESLLVAVELEEQDLSIGDFSRIGSLYLEEGRDGAWDPSTAPHPERNTIR